MKEGMSACYSWPVSRSVKTKNLKNIYWNSARQPGSGSLHGCVTWAVTLGPTVKRATCLVQWSPMVVLKFLIMVSLDLYFLREVQWDKRASAWADEICPTCVSTILCQCLLHTASAMPQKHRILRDPQCAGVQQDLKPEEGQHVCYIHDWAHGDTDSPERPYFPFEPELASNTERRQWLSKKHGWVRYPIISFMLNQPFTLKLMIYRK